MKNPRILFVDDNSIYNLDTCEVLRRSGFGVTSTYCGATAIEEISRNENLSALVTDIDLGQGDDGFEVARRARAAYPRLPVIYISGTAASRHAAEGVEGSTFMTKPCQPLEIVTALHHVIRHEAA